MKAYFLLKYTPPANAIATSGVTFGGCGNKRLKAAITIINNPTITRRIIPPLSDHFDLKYKKFLIANQENQC